MGAWVCNMITPNIAVRVAQKTNGYCFYCKKRGEEIDHFVSRYWWSEWGLSEPPANHGSVNKLDNLFLACRSCNRRKSNQPPEYFMRRGHKAWSRYERANRRVGIEEIKSPEKYPQEPFNHYEWISFLQKYG